MNIHMKIQSGLPLSLALITGCIPSSQKKTNDITTKPNILLILADDLGYSDLHCYGNNVVETPNLDQIASEGVRFTNAYASSPVCSPTRAALLTGKNPATLNLTDWIPGHQANKGPRPSEKFIVPEFHQQLPLDEITLAEMLKEAGYSTASIGKWHLGGEGFLPADQGFGLNIAGNHHGRPPSYYYPYTSEKAGFEITPLEIHGDSLYLTDRLTSEAMDFIGGHKESPFFLYLPYYIVHTPVEGRPDLVKKYEQKNLSLANDSIIRNPHFMAMIECLDENVGRLMNCLKENNLEQNTLVIFLSDNGGLLTGKGKNMRTSWNYPLRGGKGMLYEGGIRVPAIVRWTDKIKPNRISDELFISTDIFPTIAEFAGIVQEHSIEGISFVPHLLRNKPINRETLYWHYPHYHRGMPGSAIREGNYKLIKFYESETFELYDLSSDIGEKINLAAKMPEKVSELNDKIEKWKMEEGAKMPTPNPVYIKD